MGEALPRWPKFTGSGNFSVCNTKIHYICKHCESIFFVNNFEVLFLAVVIDFVICAKMKVHLEGEWCIGRPYLFSS